MTARRVHPQRERPPVELLLAALVHRYGGTAYRNAGIAAWEASCPACAHPLTIRELGYGGPVDLRCAAGCKSSEIIRALRDEPEPADPLTDRLLEIADAALEEVASLRRHVAALQAATGALRDERNELRRATEPMAEAA